MTQPAIASFFFDGRDAQKGQQVHDGLIRSLIWQFALQCQALPAVLVNLYRSGHPSIQSLEDTLYSIIIQFDMAFIIIDALDECTSLERGKVLTWIATMSSRNIGKLHIILTSRPERDIEEPLQDMGADSVDLAAESLNRDIEMYLDQELATNRKFKKWDETIRGKIKSTLRKGAQGMYVLLMLSLHWFLHILGFDGLHYRYQSWGDAQVSWLSNNSCLPCQGLWTKHISEFC